MRLFGGQTITNKNKECLKLVPISFINYQVIRVLDYYVTINLVPILFMNYLVIMLLGENLDVGQQNKMEKKV